MLLQRMPDGTLKNMHVAHYSELVLLFASITFPSNSSDPSAAKIIITYRPPQGTEKTIEVPLTPSTADLETIEVTMHNSATKAHNMGDPYNTFLSSCLGYPVILAYLGTNLRPVLMTSPNSPSSAAKSTSWYSSISSKLPTSLANLVQAEEDKITFADCAPYLVVSETSMRSVHSRLPDGEEMDITKFRPNIIVEGAEEEWEEDYWGELRIGEDVRFLCMQNCGRCQSLNIGMLLFLSSFCSCVERWNCIGGPMLILVADYATGKSGTGESGKILKKLQSDRRVDPGSKYSPIFGRYSFLDPGSEGKSVSIGDEVSVVKRNAQRTVFGKVESCCCAEIVLIRFVDWKGLSTN